MIMFKTHSILSTQKPFVAVLTSHLRSQLLQRMKAPTSSMLGHTTAQSHVPKSVETAKGPSLIQDLGAKTIKRI